MTTTLKSFSLKKLWFRRSYHEIQNLLHEGRLTSRDIFPILSIKHMYQFQQCLNHPDRKYEKKQAIHTLIQLIHFFIHPDTQDRSCYRQAQTQQLLLPILSMSPFLLFSYDQAPKIQPPSEAEHLSSIFYSDFKQMFHRLMDQHPLILEQPFFSYSPEYRLKLTTNSTVLDYWLSVGYYNHPIIYSFIAPSIDRLSLSAQEKIVLSSLYSIFDNPKTRGNGLPQFSLSFSLLKQLTHNIFQHTRTTLTPSILWKHYNLSLFDLCLTDQDYQQASEWLLKLATSVLHDPLHHSSDWISRPPYKSRKYRQPLNYYHAEWFYDFSFFCAQHGLTLTHLTTEETTSFYQLALTDIELHQQGSKHRAVLALVLYPSFAKSRFSFQGDRFETAFQEMQSYHQLCLTVQPNPSLSTTSIQRL